VGGEEKSMEEETKRSMEGRIMRGVVAVVLVSNEKERVQQEDHNMARNDENSMDENTRSVDTSCFLFCLVCCCCHQKEKNLNSQKPYLVSI
jgi:hypothetical protein